MATRRRVARWALLLVGIVRVALGVTVPIAEGQLALSTAAEWQIGGHIEETSRPECAPPHHDDCALCAHLWAPAESPNVHAAIDCTLGARAPSTEYPSAFSNTALDDHNARGPPVLS